MLLKTKSQISVGLYYKSIISLFSGTFKVFFFLIVKFRTFIKILVYTYIYRYIFNNFP